MTTATIVRELNVGDIIEIARHDEHCRLNLRRVRVRACKTRGGNHYIVGENLHGENGWDYVLPLASWDRIHTAKNNIGWFPFVDDAEFEE